MGLQVRLLTILVAVKFGAEVRPLVREVRHQAILGPERIRRTINVAAAQPVSAFVEELTARPRKHRSLLRR